MREPITALQLWQYDSFSTMTLQEKPLFAQNFFLSRSIPFEV